MTPEEKLQIVGTTVNMLKPHREAIRVGQQLTGRTFQEFACWVGLPLDQLRARAAWGRHGPAPRGTIWLDFYRRSSFHCY